MHSRQPLDRRTVLAAAVAGVGALTATTFANPSKDPQATAASLTSITDPTVRERPLRYADVPWDPDSPVWPLHTDMRHWWLIGSSTAQYASAHVAALAHRDGAQLWADAKAGETDAQISARMGLAPDRLTFPAGVVPAGRRRVWGVRAPLTTRASRPYAGRLDGTSITGVLDWDLKRRVPRFQRTDDGPQATIPARTRFLPLASPEHRADLGLFLGGGKNSITVHGVTASAVIEGWIAQHEWLVPKDARFLRQGFYPNTRTAPRSIVRTNIDTVNSWGRRTLGRRFLDIQEWLCSPAIWDLVGVTPTLADTNAQSFGNMPPSLSDSFGMHMRDFVSQAWVETVVGPRLKELGWVR